MNDFLSNDKVIRCSSPRDEVALYQSNKVIYGRSDMIHKVSGDHLVDSIAETNRLKLVEIVQVGALGYQGIIVL